MRWGFSVLLNQSTRCRCDRNIDDVSSSARVWLTSSTVIALATRRSLDLTPSESRPQAFSALQQHQHIINTHHRHLPVASMMLLSTTPVVMECASMMVSRLANLVNTLSDHDIRQWSSLQSTQSPLINNSHSLHNTLQSTAIHCIPAPFKPSQNQINNWIVWCLS